MKRYKWKLWLGSHPTITSLLVISLILTRNCDVVNAVTTPNNSNMGSNVVEATANPVAKSSTATKTTAISLKAQQLQMLREKNLNKDNHASEGYAAGITLAFYTFSPLYYSTRLFIRSFTHSFVVINKVLLCISRSVEAK